MNEERQEAYLILIDALLSCNSIQQINSLLNVKQDLIDAKLVQVMKQVADEFVEKGDNDTADFILDLSCQLSELLGLLPSTSQHTFLMQVLQATQDSNSNSQVVYSLLIANLDKLNEKFIELLQDWALYRLAEVSPEQARFIAAVIGNFSNIIRVFPQGNKAFNLEIAIAGYKIISKVFIQEKFFYEWASNQNNLGTVYFERIYGVKAENLELAIKYYMAALEEYSYTTFPQEWGTVQNGLGNVYINRIQGKRSENLENAIRCYLEALKVRNRQNFPQQWAITRHNLGVAYRNRIYGEKAENLETAIHYYKTALIERKIKSHPQQYRAETQINLGVAYSERIRGNRQKNLEVAIQCYLEAMDILTRDEFPEKWATIQNNLGTAYFDRIEGDKRKNLEQAINYYLASLKVRTYEAFPQEWADTQNNLGIAYHNRFEGDRAKNLESALNCYKAALKIRTYNAFPEKWAETLSNMGNVYKNCLQVNHEKSFKKAINCFLAALKVRTRETFPQNHIITQFNLGLVYCTFQQFTSAYNAFKACVEVVGSLRDEITLGVGKEIDKQKLAEEWNRLYRRMIEVCLALYHSREAIEYVERSKTRNLVDLILTRDRHTIFPAEVVVQLDRLRDEIASGQYELQNATAEDPTALAQHLQQLRQQRNELQDQYLPIGSGFQFEPFRSKVGDRRAIVEFYVTTDKLLVFIITKQSPQPIVLSPDLVDLKKLETWANSYLKAYSRKKDHWQRRLTTRLNLLAKILHFEEIVEQIPSECDQLTLIPHRFLHLLPLHALPLAGNTSLFERFPGGVSYAPSCQLFQLAQTRQRPEFTHLFAVQNPTGDLSYTDIEVETIKSYFSTSNLLKQQVATKEAIDETSLNTFHCAHFSCHGYFNASQPRQSALILADARLSTAPTEPEENYLSLANGGVLDLNKCLTLDKIFTLSLDKCRLVTLSACETGLIDFRNTSDEYIGLPSGFLYAGAAIVVSSLWTVNDLSTAFLMIRFYQNLKEGLAGALALNQAQLWLRDVTKGDLEAWIDENQLPLKPAVKMYLRRRLYRLEDDDQPFKSPFYWAAFCVIGQ